MIDTPTCRRCGAPLGGSYRSERVVAEHHLAELDQEGIRIGPSMLRATSACSWNCLAVLAALEAGPDADAAVQVVAERERQVTTEGWSPEHDDEQDADQLAVAGALYALHVSTGAPPDAPPYQLRSESQGDRDIMVWRWPFDPEWWKPKDRLRDLVRAAALIAAEADRDVRAKRATRKTW